MMKKFRFTSFLSKKLYKTVKNLPIIDYHNHLSVSDIMEDKRYKNITELWIAPDPYKHRAMRILGVSEKYITGGASDYEKFEVWYNSLESLVGNALFDWSVLEFKTVFGINLVPFKRGAKEVWDEANGKLATLSANKILSLFNIEYSAPCASLADDLSVYEGLSGIAPSLRGDDIVLPTLSLIEKLEKLTEIKISTKEDYISAVQKRLTEFLKVGLKFTDHALDAGFAYFKDDGKNAERFSSLLKGEALSEEDKKRLSSSLLTDLAFLYGEAGLTMQLHIGAERYTSEKLREAVGPAGGFAGIGSDFSSSAIISLLCEVEKRGDLPKTVLFTLNPKDNASLAILSGSFKNDGVRATVTQGPAWWWCDHRRGICEMLDNFASYSILSTFIGMTTDSRSIMSFARHDYFRYILAEWMAATVKKGALPKNFSTLAAIARKICYENAKERII